MKSRAAGPFTGDSKDCVTIPESSRESLRRITHHVCRRMPGYRKRCGADRIYRDDTEKYSEEELAAMEQSALQAAKEADLVVMPMGEHYLQSGEATSS